MTARAVIRQADLDRALKAAGPALRSLTIRPDGTMEVDVDPDWRAPPEPVPDNSWVYVFQVTGFELIKIGFSTNVDRRIGELQYGSGMQGGIVELLRLPGTRKTETDLHRRFAEYRLFGEWFRPDGRLAAWISEQRAASR